MAKPQPISVTNPNGSGVATPMYDKVGHAGWQDALSDYESEVRRKVALLNTWGRVYEILDSVLTGNNISVKVSDFSGSDNPQAPAFNDGTTVYLNSNVLKDVTDDTIVSLNGINYHEVAHLLFSPRAGTNLVKNIVQNGYLTAFNQLEDNRIESMLVTKYPSVRTSLIKANLEYLVNGLDKNTLVNAYPLIRGRVYLPTEVRQVCADAYVAEYGLDFTKRLCAIIDEYITLAFPQDNDRAYELVVAYSDLLGIQPQPKQSGQGNQQGQGGESNESGEGQGQQGQQSDQQGQQGQSQSGSESDQQGQSQAGGHAGHGNCDTRKPMKSGRGLSGKEQERIADRMDKPSETLDKPSDGQQGQGGESNESGEGQGNGQQGKPQGGQQGQGEGGQAGDGTTDNIRSAIDNAIDEVMKSAKTKAEVRRVRDTLRNLTGVENTLPKAKSWDNSISVEYKSTAVQFGRELDNLMRDCDPMWVTHKASGRLNVQRAMHMSVNDIDTVFDVWDSGSYAFDIEAVILLDTSGSMGNVIDEASQAMWSIKRALEEIEADVTVMGFESSGSTIYTSDEQVSKSNYRAVRAGGSTNPRTVLEQAEAILSNSKRTTKMLYVISDGQWFDSERNEAVIERINSLEGAITASVFMITPRDLQYILTQDHTYLNNLPKLLDDVRHKCQSVSLVNKPHELVSVARNIMRSLRDNVLGV